MRASLLTLRRITVHLSKRFGTQTLTVHGHAYAMKTPSGHLVVKLSTTRVSGLLRGGIGRPFILRGRRIPQWLALTHLHHHAWANLAAEAQAYVADQVRSPADRYGPLDAD